MNTAGEEFEQKILANESENPKFKFLVPGTPFHAYYKGQIERIRNPEARENDEAGERGEADGAPAVRVEEAEGGKQKFVPPVTATALFPRV